MISTQNSTTAPLASGATFTGVAEDVSRFSSVAVMCFSGGNGSTINIEMGSSPTVFDKTIAGVIAANAVYHQCHRLEGSHIRVKLINNMGATMTPRLRLVYHEVSAVNTTDQGNQRVDVESTVLPPNAATESTLETAEAILETLGTEATLSTRATEATLATRASESTLATRATEATLETRASEATVQTLATELTLLAVLQETATEVTLVSRASESTLSAMSAKLPPAQGPQLMSQSLSIVPAAGATFSVTSTPAAAASIYRNISLQGTGQVIKASAGTLRGFSFRYLGILGTVFVKLYDKATAPTTSDTPIATIAINQAESRVTDMVAGVAFAAGLGVRASSGLADNDSGAVAANTLLVEWLTYS